MKLTQRRVGILIAIALVVMMFLTIILAPVNDKNSSGSTYSRDPDGYGAWYAFMKEKGTPIQRWQKPLTALKTQVKSDGNSTLIQIYSNLKSADYLLYSFGEEWVKDGNNLVVLGVDKPVTKAKFTSFHNTNSGTVKIETRRRNNEGEQPLLEDEFGAVIWSKQVGKGKIIFSTTPYLAANAYQDLSGNYQFLAQLVTENNNSIWIDEYLHGYKDTDVIKKEIGENIFSYFAKTPLLPLSIQGIILLAVAIWATNRRFGQPLPLSTPVVNNSQAYIEALAAVLYKAKRSEFLVSTITQEEQHQLQKALGLGDISLDSSELVQAWAQQSKNPQDLEILFKIAARKRPLNDTELVQWLEKWQQIRQTI